MTFREVLREVLKKMHLTLRAFTVKPVAPIHVISSSMTCQKPGVTSEEDLSNADLSLALDLSTFR